MDSRAMKFIGEMFCWPQSMGIFWLPNLCLTPLLPTNPCFTSSSSSIIEHIAQVHDTMPHPRGEANTIEPVSRVIDKGNFFVDVPPTPTPSSFFMAAELNVLGGGVYQGDDGDCARI